MTGAGGGAAPDTGRARQWDVALSFAGPQQEYVGQVAAALKAQGVRCFYHPDEQVQLWGTNLAEELPRIYGQESAAVVVFISADYLKRDWTRLERRAVFSRAVTEDQVYVLPARFDDSELPGLLPDVVAINLNKRTPAECAAMIVDNLADRGIGPSPDARAPRQARPAGAIRVHEADPRRLGVHAAISAPGVSDEVPPKYVLRDIDNAEHGVRAKVAAAARSGGFVLLVGGSSVGKTRCAVEAVRALLPDWWLVHPDGPERVAALAAAPVPQTVIWLDELQRYLDGERGLTGGTIRELLSPPHPAVIIGTVWPERYSAYTAAPPPGGADPNARAREVLDLATPIRVDPKFSPAELGRARAAAARDPRLSRALDTTGYGLTQTLAVAPQLVAHWQDAETVNPYAWSVLTAALDAARLGARAPLSKDFLRAAAPDYLNSEQQAEAPDDWFEQALAYATGKLYGAAALSPAGAGMGKVAGYAAADYLVQHASRERRTEPVPAGLWDAILHHLSSPEDAGRLAGSARDRLLYQYAIALYRQVASTGDRYAVRSLAGLLAQRGDWDEAGRVLRARADAGDREAVAQLAELQADRGELDELRARADAGDRQATWLLADWLADWGEVAELRASAGGYTADWRLADWLADHGELDELRSRAGVGNDAAAQRLADLLADGDELDELRAWADAGNARMASRLAELLADRDELDELRARADAGNWQAVRRPADLMVELDEPLARTDTVDDHAAKRLADLLADRGELAELREWADAGYWQAAGRLADLLADRDELAELRARADAGDRRAGQRLANLLADRGDLEELRTRSDAGDWLAGPRLATRLAHRGEGAELQARADGGDWWARSLLDLLQTAQNSPDELAGLRVQADADDWQASGRLTELLAYRGELAELRARADAGDWQARKRLADVLADRDEPAELRARADAGDMRAAERLADLLADRRELAELRAWADAGNTEAAQRLASFLANRDELEELRTRASAGDPMAKGGSLAKGDLLASVAVGGRLADLLADRRELDKLRAWADTGDWSAAPRLAALLSNRRELEELRTRADAGDWWTAARLAALLANRGELDELWARAVAGDRNSGQQLPGLLERQGRGEDAERLRRFGLNPDGTIAQA